MATFLSKFLWEDLSYQHSTKYVYMARVQNVNLFFIPSSGAKDILNDFP